MEDTRLKNIKNVEESVAVFADIKEKIDTYTELGATGELAILVEESDIIKIWKDKIKPFSDNIAPLTDTMIKLDEERAELEKTVRSHLEKMDAIKKQIDNIVLKRGKGIERVSPIIIRKYGHLLNEFQQFGSIVEQDGKVYVVVKDWLASFVSGFKKKADAHKEKVTDKIIQPKILTDENDL